MGKNERPLTEEEEARLAEQIAHDMESRGATNIHIVPGKEARTLDVKCSMPNRMLGTMAHQGTARMEGNLLTLTLKPCWPELDKEGYEKLAGTAGDIIAAIDRMNEEGNHEE